MELVSAQPLPKRPVTSRIGAVPKTTWRFRRSGGKGWVLGVFVPEGGGRRWGNPPPKRRMHWRAGLSASHLREIRAEKLKRMLKSCFGLQKPIQMVLGFGGARFGPCR